MSLYYQDENVTLYHGDCLKEHREWLDADVLVTDPPYGMNYSPRGTYDPKTGKKSAANTQRIASDQNTTVRDSAIHAWGTRPRIVFGTWRMPRPEPVEHRLIWHKRGMPPGPSNAPFMLQDEEIYVTGKGFRPSSPPLRSVIPTDELRQGATGEVAKTGHPTPKPVNLMEILIDRCPPGTIADPFAGSGATLVAARNLGRKAIGVELEERYCEIIASRLSQGAFDFNTV